VDAMMDRLQRRVGFRVHAHAFRHTFATVATQLGWNFERLRAAMGHADYNVLQRYVRLATGARPRTSERVGRSDRREPGARVVVAVSGGRGEWRRRGRFALPWSGTGGG
jgi:hypothetical protein